MYLHLFHAFILIALIFFRRFLFFHRTCYIWLSRRAMPTSRAVISNSSLFLISYHYHLTFICFTFFIYSSTLPLSHLFFLSLSISLWPLKVCPSVRPFASCCVYLNIIKILIKASPSTQTVILIKIKNEKCNHHPLQQHRHQPQDE